MQRSRTGASKAAKLDAVVLFAVDIAASVNLTAVCPYECDKPRSVHDCVQIYYE
jgi:hypothetical protein